MNQVMAKTAPQVDEEINKSAKLLGQAIFQEMGRQTPSAFNKRESLSRLMEWSMTQPEFKLNMFRLVDVLPVLRSSAAIQSHVNEYLGHTAGRLHALMSWGLKAPPRSLRAKLTSFFVKSGVNQMAAMFIAGEDARAALKELKRTRAKRLAYTVDLLGEFCVSEKEAEVYVERYLDALKVFGAEAPKWRESLPIIESHPGEKSPVCISVKPTALYSQCGPLNFKRSVEIISERLSRITRKAQELGALIYIDAEDSANNPIIYEVFKQVYGSEEFRSFAYPGIVVQAYYRTARECVVELLEFAKKRGSPIAIRLVKGAYWDYETLMCRQNGWPSPLFSQKESSDANFEDITRLLLENTTYCLPAFGSHNVRSLAYACSYAKRQGLDVKDFELQMLYGMAEPIADAFAKQGYLVRLYVPLGEMISGMGYLVRRLLENTSNESFLRHTFFEAKSVDHLLREPSFRD